MELAIRAWIWAFAAGGAVGAAAGWACLERHAQAFARRPRPGARGRNGALPGACRRPRRGRDLAGAASGRAAGAGRLRGRGPPRVGAATGAHPDAGRSWRRRWWRRRRCRQNSASRPRPMARSSPCWVQVRGEIEKDFKALAADALRANQGTFVELASAVFEKHKAGADADHGGAPAGRRGPGRAAPGDAPELPAAGGGAGAVARRGLRRADRGDQGRGRGPERGPQRDGEARQCPAGGAQDARALGRADAAKCPGIIGA